MRKKQLAKITEKSADSRRQSLSKRIHSILRTGSDIIDLTANEPDFPTPDHIKKAGIAAIEHNLTTNFPGNDLPDLRDAISSKFRSENNVHLSPDEILITHGEKDSLFIALRTLCDPGDEVIISSPYSDNYVEAIRSVGARPIIVETTEAHGFKITGRQLRKALSLKSKVYIINSPSNPTGVVYSHEEIEDIAFVIADAGLYVISDEIFEHFVYDGVRHVSIGSIDTMHDFTVTIKGISQTFSMTGWNFACMGAQKSIIEKVSEIQNQITVNASFISQKAALAALTSPTDTVHSMQEEFEHRRNYVIGELGSIRYISCIKPKGGIYVFPRVDEYYGTSYGKFHIRSDMDLCEYLLTEGKVATLPGSQFGSSDNIRLSLTLPIKQLKQGMQRIGNYLSLLRS
jgi:aspartate aminotransferase